MRIGAALAASGSASDQTLRVAVDAGFDGSSALEPALENAETASAVLGLFDVDALEAARVEIERLQLETELAALETSKSFLQPSGQGLGPVPAFPEALEKVGAPGFLA